MKINVATLAGRKAAFLVGASGIFSFRQEAKTDSWLIVVEGSSRALVCFPKGCLCLASYFCVYPHPYTNAPIFSPTSEVHCTTYLFTGAKYALPVNQTYTCIYIYIYIFSYELCEVELGGD